MNKNTLIFVIILTSFFCFLYLVSTIFLVLFVKKDIEKKYNTKLDFPTHLKFSPWGFVGKYDAMGMNIIIMYLIERNIIKKNKYFKYLFLTKINYTTVGEKKINIFICFLSFFSGLLALVLGALIIYIGNQVYKA
ncbi:MAG: hypothetical protein V4591_08150 [Bdellovibrionota bacterium]